MNNNPPFFNALTNKNAKNESAATHIEKLLLYASQHNLIYDDDCIVARNALFDLFCIEKPSSNRLLKRSTNIGRLSDALSGLVDFGVQLGLAQDTPQERGRFATKVMGILTPRQSEITSKFKEIAAHSPVDATKWFFELSKSTGFIRDGKILHWKNNTKYGTLEIAINTARPKNGSILDAYAPAAPLYGVYPKCALCTNAVGFKGSSRFPPMDNHRIIPIKRLGGASRHWHLMFSPYQYYDEQCYIPYQNHIPLSTGKRTFEAMFDFLGIFPHYFIGVEADLPIIGGDFYTHEHFLGGHKSFPIENASVLYKLTHANFKAVTVEVLSWPVCAMRLYGGQSCKNTLSDLAMYITNFWRKYSCENTITNNSAAVMLKINNKKDNRYELYIVLRNNETISKEQDCVCETSARENISAPISIGLIEVLGLGRLHSSFAYGEIKTGSDANYGINELKASELAVKNTFRKFQRSLEDCSVFKNNEDSKPNLFLNFIIKAGFKCI